MKRTTLMPLLVVMILAASSCAKMITKEEAFPKMYDEHPKSILVLPPINESTAADAKDYYSTTIAEPLSNMGYYVFPLEVVSDVFKQEGLYDTELLVDLPPQKFKEYFDADAVLYIKILKWDTAYFVLGGSVTVSVDFLLRSTTTGEELWKYDGTITVDTTGDTGGAPGLAGLLVLLATTAIKTAATDYVPLAKQANVMTLTSCPCGQYHEMYNKDQKVKTVMEQKVKAEDEEKKDE